MRQAPQAIDRVADVFHLSAGEATFLRAAETGDGLLAVDRRRAGFRAVASEAEYDAITSDPADLAAQEAQWARAGQAAGATRGDQDGASLRVIRGGP